MSEVTKPDTEREFANAAARLFPDATSVTPIHESHSIAKVETPSGAFALRRWPAGTTPERVKFVHSLLLTLSKLSVVPKVARTNGDSISRVDQGLYDAVTWLEGKPLRRPVLLPRLQALVSLPRTGSIEIIAELTSALAEMHVASKSLAEKGSTPKLPINALIPTVRDSWMRQRGHLRPIAHLTPDIQRWLRTGERALPLAEKIIAGLPEDALSDLVVAHGNLWPTHVLIERHGSVERLTGVLDFKQAVASSPLFDLAQIAGRFNGWSDETAEIVLGAYGETGRLTPSERRVLPAIATLDLVAEAGRILVTTYAELGSPNAPVSMREGAETMLRSLESATRTMERIEGINQPGPRKWVHRPPRPGQPSKPSKSRSQRPQRPKKPTSGD
jgi:Ser/Thr protein kinase RdoA (MazF antagonist)